MATVTQLAAKVTLDTSGLPQQLEATQRGLVQGVGSAAQQAQLRMDALSERIGFQQRALALLGQSLDAARQKYGDGSQQVERAQLSYDRLSASIQQNQRQIPVLSQRLQEINTHARDGATYAQQFGTAFTGQLTSMIGPAALAAGAIGAVFGAISAGRQAGAAALELRETENALRAVSGSARVYSEALATARQQQLLFGGSLKENIDGLQGLVITARDTGANLQALVDLTQRLEIKSPEQGVGGARIALAEALSEGNITSLRRRFEIPKEALEGLKDASLSAEDRLKVLSDYLDGIGISSAAVAGRVDEQAQAYRRLGVELGDLSTNTGGRLADFFERSATGLSRIIGLINGNPKALAELKATFTLKGGIDQSDIDIAARNLAERAARDELGGERGRQVVMGRLGGAENYAETINALTQLNLRGEASAQMARNLVREFIAGAKSADEFTAALQGMIAKSSEGARQLDEVSQKQKKLSEEDRDRLEQQRDQTLGRAQDAYTRLAELDADYERERGDRARAHQEKLADIADAGGARIAQITRQTNEAQLDADRAYIARRAELSETLAQRLAELDTAHAADTAKRQEDAARRSEALDTALQERLLDARKASAARIAELEASIGDDSAARREAQSERAADAAERQAEQEQRMAERLADFDAQQLERRQQAREQYADRVASLAQQQADAEQRAREQAQDAEERSREQQADREQAYQDRLRDMAESAADRSEDRARQHADRLAAIEEQSQSRTALGRTTTLRGETFYTEYQQDTGSRGGKTVAQQVEEENERYRKQQDADARDEQRQREKLERDRARQEEDAARDAARQREKIERDAQRRQEEAARALADLDARYAAEEAKAAEKAERDRARILADGEAQRAALEEDYARREAQIAAQDAKEDARRQQQIAKEREKLAALEADAVADTARQQARLADDLARELAERDAAYVQQRAKAQAQAAEQLADLEASYVAATAKRAEQADRQRADVAADTERRLAEENDAYARQEAQRADAYARQREQLATALGEQLQAYTEIQVKLGDITQAEGDRRTAIIAEQYLQQAKAQKEAFDRYFNSDVAADRSYDDIEDMRARRPSNGGPGTLSIGQIVLPNVQKPEQFLPELRTAVQREIAANGGDVSKYWSGR